MNGSPTQRAERAATGRRPSEPEPGNAGAGSRSGQSPSEGVELTPEGSNTEQAERAGEPLDLLIVGGGVIGLAIAWRAARRGLRVRLLERDRPGSGASGVAAGMLAPVGEATWGEDSRQALALASHRAWPAFATELATDAGRPVSYVTPGAVHVALDRDEAAALRRRFELMESLGLEADWLGGRDCRRLEPGLSPAALAGIHAPHEAAVDPGTLVATLARAAERRGAELVSDCEVVAALGSESRIEGVADATGNEHRSAQTVLASGAWSGQADWLPRAAQVRVRPVKGQILTLRGERSRPVCEHLVASEWIYAVPRADGRLVVGATVEELGFDDRVTAGGVHELLREAYRALPEIAELEFERAVTGFRPGTPDNSPLIGPGAIAGLLIATGHYRNGVLLAPATAEAICDFAIGVEPQPELAGADPARFSAPSPTAAIA